MVYDIYNTNWRNYIDHEILVFILRILFLQYLESVIIEHIMKEHIYSEMIHNYAG